MKRSSSKKMIVSVLVLIGLCMTLLTTGCQARAKKMTPEYLDVMFDGSNKLDSVIVNEAKVPMEPNPRWGAGIPMTEFTWAVKAALEQSGVVQEVKAIGDEAAYVLDVAILDYDQPLYGSSMTVRMETKWKLTDAKTQEVVWSNTFPMVHKVVWIESLGSIADWGRAQRAQELAAQATIKEGIRRLSALEL
ncbi:MAG: hypothetical protein ACYSUG_00720 [Planctomycetota bacterium]